MRHVTGPRSQSPFLESLQRQPGRSSPLQNHAGSVFAFVLSGEVRSQNSAARSPQGVRTLWVMLRMTNSAGRSGATPT